MNARVYKLLIQNASYWGLTDWRGKAVSSQVASVFKMIQYSILSWTIQRRTGGRRDTLFSQYRLEETVREEPLIVREVDHDALLRMDFRDAYR